MRELKIIRWILMWTTCCGALLLFAGALRYVMPVAALDAVLTPEQLADPAIREPTQARLFRLWGDSWITLALAGIAICIPGLVGLWFVQLVERKQLGRQ